MAVEHVIYIVVDVDEVPVRAFTRQRCAESFVLASKDLHVVPVPLGPLEPTESPDES